MEFGKVANPNEIDFSFPTEDHRSRKVLHADKDLKGFEVFIGAPVWGVKTWVGKIYPTGAKANDFLKHYARQFNCIELNTTHYRIPDKDTILKWRESVPKHFRFCPKFPQEISHKLWHKNSVPLTRQFCDAIMGLQENLGTSFLQLPPGFSLRDLPLLQSFLRDLPPGFQLAVEVRHPSWFHNHTIASPLFELLYKNKVGILTTDVAGRRDVLHTSLTKAECMVRFIGNELHPSDYSRADDWTRQIAAWKDEGLKRLYFFVHQPGDTLIPELADYFTKKLNERLGLNIRSVQLPSSQQEQLGLF